MFVLLGTIANLLAQQDPGKVKARVGSDVSLVCVPDGIDWMLYGGQGGAYPLYAIDWTFSPQHLGNRAKYVDELHHQMPIATFAQCRTNRHGFL